MGPHVVTCDPMCRGGCREVGSPPVPEPCPPWFQPQLLPAECWDWESPQVCSSFGKLPGVGLGCAAPTCYSVGGFRPRMSLSDENGTGNEPSVLFTLALQRGPALQQCLHRAIPQPFPNSFTPCCHQAVPAAAPSF